MNIYIYMKYMHICTHIYIILIGCTKEARSSDLWAPYASLESVPLAPKPREAVNPTPMDALNQDTKSTCKRDLFWSHWVCLGCIDGTWGLQET